jgi:hypothetical protein
MDTVRNIATVIMLALIAIMLMACAAPLPVQVKIPIPVACRETEPEVPIMPTDQLSADATLDQFVQAVAAEIERRQGYEVQLVTALRACIAPINPKE